MKYGIGELIEFVNDVDELKIGEIMNYNEYSYLIRWQDTHYGNGKPIEPHWIKKGTIESVSESHTKKRRNEVLNELLQ